MLDPFAPRIPEAPPKIVLGAMNFGKRTPPAESERIVLRALERGVTWFDTANAYTDGESEKILGRALRSRRHEVTIATKVGFGRGGGKPEGLSRARILAAADESLARLGVEKIDLYYLHVPDHATPIEESLAAMGELRERGKIGALGVSNYAAWQILDMMGLSEKGPAPRPVVSQVLYNLLIRELDVEYASFTREHPIHTTVFNALAGGLLSGKHERSAPPAKGTRFDGNRLYESRYWTARMFDLVEAYAAVAKDEGLSLVELAYAWLASRPVVDSILVGPATVEQLDAALDGAAKPLSADGKRRIDAIWRAHLGTESSYVR